MGKEFADRAETDEVYKTARTAMDKIEQQYAQLRGPVAPEGVRSLIKKYLPIATKMLGYGTPAAALTALSADTGAFGGLIGGIKSLIGLG